MINKESFINESKLSKFIGRGTDVVNLKDDHFEYCNGYMIVNCTYDLDLVIQKLFKVGAISNYRNWTPKKTMDLSETLKIEDEVEAEKTGYLKEYDRGDKFLYVIKIGNRFVYYDKKYLDCFQDVQYKAADNDNEYPILKIYGDGKLVAALMPVRDSDRFDLLTKIIAGRSHE